MIRRLSATHPAWVAAAAITATIITFGTWRASLSIDGQRHFWLDDDQMISMRYARNLIRGDGLVYNRGERVEGYSNLLWTLTMAAVHLLPLAPAKTAIAIKALNLLLAWLVLLASLRLLRQLWPRQAPALAWWLLPLLALTTELTFWAALGFETTLLTALFLFVLQRLFDESATGPRAGTLVLLALVPLVRADALVWWTALAVPAIVLAPRRGRVAALLALTLVPCLAHLLFRWGYYGDIVPNTYHLRVAEIDRRLLRGLRYLAAFGRHYTLPLLALGWLLVRNRDRRIGLIALSGAVPLVYSAYVGGDMFLYSRYLAPLVPLLLAGGLAALDPLRATWPRPVARAALVLATLAQVGLVTPSRLELARGFNGEPHKGVVAGVLVARHTPPTARVAVMAAGCVAYFGDRTTVDLLGKNDPSVARLTPVPNQALGVNKFDIEQSLRGRPELVVSFWPHRWLVSTAPPSVASWPLFAAFRTSPILRREYFDQIAYEQQTPIPLPHRQTGLVIYRREVRQGPDAGPRWPAPRLR